MGIKPHENVIFSCFGVYFFIHLNIAIVSISLFSFLVVMVRFFADYNFFTRKKCNCS